jgi:hypothetical protein
MRRGCLVTLGVAVLLLALVALLLVAGDADEDTPTPVSASATCAPGTLRDSQTDDCLVTLDTFDAATVLGAGFHSPDDCLDDEHFDALDRLCYLAVSDDTHDRALLDDLLALVWDPDREFADPAYLEEQAIITYEVRGLTLLNPQPDAVPAELLPYQADVATHQAIWQFYTRLIPAEQRELITRFAIFTDGLDNVYASVMQDEDNPLRWVLAVDIADSTNRLDLTYNLLHEFGHLLTLNEHQVRLDPDLFYRQDDEELYTSTLNACPTYFPGEGCSYPDSYINLFYERFWTDLSEEHWDIEAIADEDEYAAALVDFYERYADQFVTEYAATTPAEDIAESWAAFVLQPRPAGDTIAERKVLFFYEFPELVQLRADIIARIIPILRR